MARSLTQAKAAIRGMGMAVSSFQGELRVTFQRMDMPNATEREAVAYYTTDTDDAVDTARAMLIHAQAKGHTS